MHKRSYLIGAMLALSAIVAVPGIAHAAVTSQKLTVNAAPSVQDSRVPGPVGLDVTIDTFESAPTDVSQTAAQTVLTFDQDFSLGNTGSLGQCNASTLANTTTEQAKALCGPTQVGAGASTVCSAAAGCGVTSLPGIVTAFNGVPSGGLPTIILHNRIGPPANVTTVLNGVLSGDVLTVSVPDTAATGLHLTRFFTSVPIKATGTMKNKPAIKKAKKKCKTIGSNSKRGKCLKKAKKKRAQSFYISARCTQPRVWSFTETTTFRGGAPPQTSSTGVPCLQKKVKKKKKKK